MSLLCTLHLEVRKPIMKSGFDGEKTETIEEPETVEPISYDSTDLPRKFTVGVAFPGDNCVDIYTQDIGLVARLEGETLTGFTVVIGGGMGMTTAKAIPILALRSHCAMLAPMKLSRRQRRS